MPRKVWGEITYPYWDQSQSMLVKGATGNKIADNVLTEFD